MTVFLRSQALNSLYYPEIVSFGYKSGQQMPFSLLIKANGKLDTWD